MKNYFSTIEKEAIVMLQFPNSDVLSDEEMKKIRKMELEKALSLGNTEKIKHTIYFEDATQQKLKVHTTIWGLTDDTVILKKGTVLPVRSIHFID